MKYTSKLILNGTEYEFAAGGGGGWQPGENTLLYLPLKTDMLDHSGNNISMTDVNVSIQDGALRIDNTNDNSYLKTTNGFNSSLSSLPFTVMFWVKYNYLMTGMGDERGRTTGCNKDSSYRGWNITQGYDNGNVKFRSEFLPGGSLLGTTNISTGVRYHVCVSADSNGRTLYVNGQSEGTGSSSITFADNSLFVGQNPFNNRDVSPTRGINGYVSEYIVEDKAWSAQEIEDYFNQTKSLYGIS